MVSWEFVLDHAMGRKVGKGTRVLPEFVECDVSVELSKHAQQIQGAVFMDSNRPLPVGRDRGFYSLPTCL